MLKSVAIRNFKSFVSGSSIDLESLTVVSGKNNSGKSSLYQPLLCLSQSAMDKNSIITPNSSVIPVLNTYGELIKLGSPSELVPDKHNKMVLSLVYDDALIDFKYKLIKSGELVLSDQTWEYFSGNRKTGYTYNYDVSRNRIRVTGDNCFSFSSYYVKHELESILVEMLKTPVDEECFYRSHVSFLNVIAVRFIHQCLDCITIPLESIKSILSPSVLKKIDFNSLVERMKISLDGKTSIDLSVVSPFFFTNILPFEQVIAINPFRGIPKRYYDYVLDRDIIDSYKHRLPIDSEIVYRFDSEGNPVKASVEEAIGYWTQRILGVDGLKVIDRNQGVNTEILVSYGKKKYPINTVGYGLGQSIPIIVKLLTRPNQYLYVIDEPEVHLHPHAQIQFAEFLQTMAKVGKQILMETHSEYMINYFVLDSIRSNSEIGLFWVDKENDDSKIVRIEFDEYGFIKNRPVGFSDGMEDLAGQIFDVRMTKM